EADVSEAIRRRRSPRTAPIPRLRPSELSLSVRRGAHYLTWIAVQQTTQTAPDGDLGRLLDARRVDLTAYCYRMLASPFEAEDAVQETMLRAWKAYEKFEGRSAMRTWLHRIATNVCLDM